MYAYIYNYSMTGGTPDMVEWIMISRYTQ